MNDHNINRHLAEDAQSLKIAAARGKPLDFSKCVTRSRWQSAMQAHERTGQCDWNDEEKLHCLVCPICGRVQVTLIKKCPDPAEGALNSESTTSQVSEPVSQEQLSSSPMPNVTRSASLYKSSRGKLGLKVLGGIAILVILGLSVFWPRYTPTGFEFQLVGRSGTLGTPSERDEQFQIKPTFPANFHGFITLVDIWETGEITLRPEEPQDWQEIRPDHVLKVLPPYYSVDASLTRTVCILITDKNPVILLKAEVAKWNTESLRGIPPEKTEQQLRAFLAERGIATYPQRVLVIPPKRDDSN